MRIKTVFTGLLVFVALFSLEADDRLFFTSMGTRDGLPNAAISAIVQDAKGFLWFGTQGGLVRYDGYSFKVFENIPFEKNAFSHNQVQTLFLDGDYLWVGTYGGLNRLDLKTEQITKYLHDPLDPESLRADLVSAIARDKQGRLWVGTAKGLDLLDEESGHFTRYEQNDPADPLSNVLIRDLHLDASGMFWVATHGRGLFYRDSESSRFIQVPQQANGSRSLPSVFIMSISEDPDGELWFGSWFGGISRLTDRAAFEFETIRLEDDRIYFVAALDSRKVLAGSWGGGLFIYDTENGSIVRKQHSDGQGSIPNDVVYSVYLDTNQVYWIGTNGGGPARSERVDSRYRMFMHDPDREDTLSAGKVTALVEDHDGLIWVGMYNGGLNLLDPVSGKVKRYVHDNNDPNSLPDNIINDLFIDSFGKLWVLSNGGFAQYNRELDNFTVHLPDPDNPHAIADLVTYTIQEAPDGNLWLGTFTHGLNLYERASGRFLQFPPDAASDTAPADSLVYALEFDEQGRLWVGYNNGLDRYENGRFIRYRYDMNNPEGISSNTIRNMYLDSRKRLWLGTVGGGIMRYNPESDTFSHFTKKEGLPDNTVRSILEDDKGDLWIGTATGIGIIDGDDGFVRGYTVYNDLKDRDFHTGALKSRDGYLYFGGQNTIYQLDPLDRSSIREDPRLVLSELLVNGKTYRSAEENLSAAYVNKLELSYQENNFSISFASADYRDPDRNMYSYKLENYDKDWSVPSFNRTVSYTNLPGGTYTLKVRVSDNDGYWNDEALQLPVRISSPPWLSPPAFLFYFIALVGLGFMVASLMGKKSLQLKIIELMRVQTELEEANKRLDELSTLDGLTGIPNRRRLDQLFPRLYAEAAREKKSLSVIMLDIDFFKGYNDYYGHLKGDEVLKAVALVLTKTLERETDFVARYGGEEFIAILANTSQKGVYLVAERMRKAVEEEAMPNAASSIAPVITISAGTASAIPEYGKDPARIIDQADSALYKAKSTGRNRTIQTHGRE